jgi:hypothetical protein
MASAVPAEGDLRRQIHGQIPAVTVVPEGGRPHDTGEWTDPAIWVPPQPLKHANLLREGGRPGEGGDSFRRRIGAARGKPDIRYARGWVKITHYFGAECADRHSGAEDLNIQLRKMLSPSVLKPTSPESNIKYLKNFSIRNQQGAFVSKVPVDREGREGPIQYYFKSQSPQECLNNLVSTGRTEPQDLLSPHRKPRFRRGILYIAPGLVLTDANTEFIARKKEEGFQFSYEEPTAQGKKTKRKRKKQKPKEKKNPKGKGKKKPKGKTVKARTKELIRTRRKKKKK